MKTLSIAIAALSAAALLSGCGRDEDNPKAKARVEKAERRAEAAEQRADAAEKRADALEKKLAAERREDKKAAKAPAKK
jgi:hypothetical protein